MKQEGILSGRFSLKMLAQYGGLGYIWPQSGYRDATMRKTTALLLFLLSAQAGAVTQVQAVHFIGAADTSRLVLELSTSPDYKVFTLADPPRVVIDVRDARLAATLPGDFANGPVQDLRSGIRHGRDLRLVMDLKAATPYKSFVLQPSGRQGYRLVVDLDRGTGAAPAAAPVPVKAPAPAAVPPVAETPATPAYPANDTLRDLIVAIDAGHGGVDPGAQGPDGVKEKDVTLAISRELQDQFNEQPGIKAVLTRDGDYFVPLRQRVAKARQYKADLLISIHADAIDDHSVRGSSVYVLSERGASSEAARWLAEKENAADLVGGVSLDDKGDVLRSVLLDLSQTATIEASAKAGREVLQQLGDVGRLHRHQVEQAGFVVLKAPDIPSMLVETAFITNPAEEHKLRSPAYQKKLAAAIVEGVLDYFHANAPPGTKLAAANVMRRHVIAKGDTLSAIANQYGVSVNTLRVSNKLSGDRLYVGTVLRIPPDDGT
jgi:N-acetylmuramoyl-L-alanine amidase